MNDKTNPPPSGKASKTKARVLVAVTIDGTDYAPNDIASVDDAALKAHHEVLDRSPAAVKYAESLRKSAAADSED